MDEEWPIYKGATMKLPFEVIEEDVEKFIGVTDTVLSAIENCGESIPSILQGEHLEEMARFLAKWKGACMSAGYEFGKSEGIPSKDYD